MLEEVFLPLDVPEETIKSLRNDQEETRPHLEADLGPPYGRVKILYPPNGRENVYLTCNNLIQLMREYKIIPIQIGHNFQFVSWKEARDLFDSLLDKYLHDNFNIICTDRSEKESNNDTIEA